MGIKFKKKNTIKHIYNYSAVLDVFFFRFKYTQQDFFKVVLQFYAYISIVSSINGVSVKVISIWINLTANNNKFETNSSFEY